ncbi:glycerophosphodiester phosphodiesterase family protein [Paenibacillus sp. JX-17]|uniref:Glycerophosphodiester phosphodiesterase family protein n=1 Tax=Paenibacillus lacisoli TaxID=3064525 RepID=A0ABT9C9V0_9BACL|nr:glycerophosphodiester phosphodiesterase family protein [Paenibacillus sp. JX-17]MDO7906032.1 glycerophosphodiester phosphodiesterase family protein [Paenibacillus sp. JX-17]
MANLCVAHRGHSRIAPENTMAAFRRAVELAHVSWMELDVQLSKDGIPVVIHDFKLERTTNGQGRVADLTWEELRRLDAGGWKDRAYSGEKIPSLNEVLKLCKGRMKLNIELKTSGQMYPGLEQAVLEDLREHEMEQDVVITSFDHGALTRMKEIAPGIQTGLIMDARPADLLQRVLRLGCSFLSIGYPWIDSRLMKEMNDAGIKVMVWTVDSRRMMRRMAFRYPGLMICTNRPDIWEHAMALKRWALFRR